MAGRSDAKKLGMVDNQQQQKDTFYSVIAQTILQSKSQALCVSEIYTALEQNYGDSLNVNFVLYSVFRCILDVVAS